MPQKTSGWKIFHIICTLLLGGVVAYYGITLDEYKASLVEKQQDIDAMFKKRTIALKEIEHAAQQALKHEDQRIAKIAIVEKLIPHIVADEMSRKVSLTVMTTLQHEDLALSIASLFDDDTTQKIADGINQDNISNKDIVPVLAKNNSSSTETKKGWVYVGRIKNNQWEGNTLVLGENNTIESIKGKTVKVKDGKRLNVRSSHPSWGQVAPVIDTLLPESTVILGQNVNETFNKYVWIEVEYQN